MASRNQIKQFEGEFYFLSNFYAVPIEFEGLRYPSIENAFQAAKTLEQEMRVQFTTCTPSASKKLGRNVELRPNWDQVKIGIMKSLLDYKFSKCHPVLRQRLIDTGDHLLVEGNIWHDNIWGDCRCFETTNAQFGRKDSCVPEGQNKLGNMLMVIRQEISVRS